MENYVITTDNTADLPYSYYKEHQVEYMYLTYQAVIMVSSELAECMGVSDRIYVMHEGEMTGIIEGEDMKNVTEELVVGYATGAKTNMK